MIDEERSHVALVLRGRLQTFPIRFCYFLAPPATCQFVDDIGRSGVSLAGWLVGSLARWLAGWLAGWLEAATGNNDDKRRRLSTRDPYIKIKLPKLPIARRPLC